MPEQAIANKSTPDAEVTPTHYAIEIGEFGPKEGFQPTEYEIGDVITRENFMSWFIRGFAISRGVPSVQDAFVAWSSENVRFDFRQTFENLNYLGGFTALSPSEKQLFNDTYQKVSRHPTPHSLGRLEPEIEEYIQVYAKMNATNQQIADKVVQGAKINGMSKVEFMKLANEYILKKK